MSNKNYRTINGLYKALLKQKKHLAYDYTFQKNDEDITIFNAEYSHGSISGFLIQDLMPVLKRSVWMVNHSYVHDRVELVVWIADDNV